MVFNNMSDSYRNEIGSKFAIYIFFNALSDKFEAWSAKSALARTCNNKVDIRDTKRINHD